MRNYKSYKPETDRVSFSNSTAPKREKVEILYQQLRQYQTLKPRHLLMFAKFLRMVTIIPKAESLIISKRGNLRCSS